MAEPKILLLSPRLDVPFKDLNSGYIPPKSDVALPPIRQHWAKFQTYLQRKLPNVTVLEEPLWKFTLAYVKEVAKNYDYIYVPHKQKVDFNVDGKAIYYAQTVVPDFFTLDTEGWGASMSWIDKLTTDVEPTDDDRAIFNSFWRRTQRNESKFDQPTNKLADHWENYILFVCQIPHDETIKYHSDVSVKTALMQTLGVALELGKQVVVKGHPVNPGAMGELRDLAVAERVRYGNVVTYEDSVSIHDCLRRAESVFLVNSGVGFEAMLHGKPVFRFGDAEYRNVTPYVGDLKIYDIADKYEALRQVDMNKYVRFISQFFARCHRAV